MTDATTDSFRRPQAGKHELDATGTNRVIFRRVHFERLLPGRWHLLQKFRVVTAGQEIPHFDPDTLREDLGDLGEPVFVDVVGDFNCLSVFPCLLQQQQLNCDFSSSTV